MNNSSGWADLWLGEASGSCSVLWYHDLVNAPSVAWHWLFGNAGTFHNRKHALAVSPLPQFFSFLLHTICQAIYPPPNIHIFYILTIFSLVSVSSHTLFLCNYFEISSQCVVYNGSIWHWVCHSLVGTHWKRATPLYYWYSGYLRLNGEWAMQVFFSLWKYEWRNMNATNNYQ